MPKVPYECPRCGLCTTYKTHMKKHLYHNKKPCPAIKFNIDLVDEIKECILDNRIYHVYKEPNVMNHNINNYNTIYNFISNLDHQSKLERYCKYKNIQLITFEDQVCNTFSKQIADLDNCTKKSGAIRMTTCDLLETIDKVTKATNIEDNNVYFDSSKDKIKIFETCLDRNNKDYRRVEIQC
jgi:hypothetical protein